MANFDVSTSGAVLTNAQIADPFTNQFPNGLSTTELNQYELAGLITPAQRTQQIANMSLPANVSQSTLDALTQAALSVDYSGNNDGTTVTTSQNNPASVAASTTTSGTTSTTNTDASDGITVTGNLGNIMADQRIRLSALSGQESVVYGAQDRSSNILTPLYDTGGFMFPYTPTISVSGETDWTSSDLTHTNYDILSYKKTSSANIGLSGKFTVQNQREGEYALACIHFLRTVGKMYYGDQDSANFDPQNKTTTNSKAGLPPPVLRLNGYGNYMFNNIRCVLKNYSFSFEEGQDMIPITLGTGGTVLLPPLFTLTVGIALQQNATNLRTKFYLDDFRTGALMNASGGGWF